LDMLRGIAALGVVLGHTRGFIIVDYGSSSLSNLPIQVFYFVTGLGHQCVLAFFALSGYLVGGSASREIFDHTWSWPHYMLRRLTRLWTVLIPALFLTLLCDSVGRAVSQNSGYDGVFYNLLASGPQTPIDLSSSTFIANVMFLQTIVAPAFGSNGPLWSLANEFWYYVMFPLIFFGLIKTGSLLTRTLAPLMGIALAMLLPHEMVFLGSIWVAGAVGYQINRRAQFCAATRHPLWLIISLSTIAVMLVLSKLRPGLWSDLLLGGAFAIALPACAVLQPFGNIYERIADSLSKISYTLYATHFPVLAFLWFVALAPRKWPVGPAGISLMMALAVTTLVVATGMWWLFEGRTDVIRKALEARLWSHRQTPQGRRT
jgi:peptidoglycan/LPS O-acetylase OafA/YrhL